MCVEVHGLSFGGGGAPDRGWSGVICRDDRYASTTESDKAAVHGRLEKRLEVDSVRLSAFWDVWYGP
jgi:uncharacterized protein YggL (DUF469 family)